MHIRETHTLNREQLVAIVDYLDAKLLVLELKWDRLVELLSDGANICDDEVDSLVRKINLQLSERRER